MTAPATPHRDYVLGNRRARHGNAIPSGPLVAAGAILFAQDTGETYQFAFLSPKNGSTLSQADLDSVYYDCYLFNNEAKAKPAFSYTVTFPYPHQAQVLFYGAVSDPLDAPAGPITWNVRTVLNTSNPTAPTGYVNYNTTCFPAHEVQVDNGTPLFSYMPSTSATAYIATCLGLNGTTGINPIVGQTQPTAIH